MFPPEPVTSTPEEARRWEIAVSAATLCSECSEPSGSRRPGVRPRRSSPALRLGHPDRLVEVARRAAESLTRSGQAVSICAAHTDRRPRRALWRGLIARSSSLERNPLEEVHPRGHRCGGRNHGGRGFGRFGGRAPGPLPAPVHDDHGHSAEGSRSTQWNDIWTHAYNVTLNPCDGSFTGTGTLNGTPSRWDSRGFGASRRSRARSTVTARSVSPGRAPRRTVLLTR